MINNSAGNALISYNLKNDISTSIVRLGVIESNSIAYYLHTQTIPEQLTRMLQNNAGVYGDSIDDFVSEYIQCLSVSDIHAVINDDSVVYQYDYIKQKLNLQAASIEHRSVEPFYFDDPWSRYLTEKKVLVISPFADSIQRQYINNQKNIWNNQLILPKFNLVTYRSVQSIGNDGPDNNWLCSLNKMKQDISAIDFDIALLGCGAYGNPLVSYIHKQLNKTAIYIGGGLQILFGIKGKRWDDHDIISKMYNDYWIRPLDSEKPKLFKSVENGCYW